MEISTRWEEKSIQGGSMILTKKTVSKYYETGITPEVKILNYFFSNMNDECEVVGNISDISRKLNISRVTIHKILKKLYMNDLIKRRGNYITVLTIFKKGYFNGRPNE